MSELREKLEWFRADLCNAGCAVECATWEKRKALIDDVIDKYAQAIADMFERGTCRLEETESYPSECGMVHVLECSNCGRECEHVNGDYEHCPHCLARNELF